MDIGNVLGMLLYYVYGDVDLLVRFDDLSLNGVYFFFNGMVEWVCYEGESCLYVVMLDNGSYFKVRVSYENVIKSGECVYV